MYFICVCRQQINIYMHLFFQVVPIVSQTTKTSPSSAWWKQCSCNNVLVCLANVRADPYEVICTNRLVLSGYLNMHQQYRCLWCEMMHAGRQVTHTYCLHTLELSGQFKFIFQIWTSLWCLWVHFFSTYVVEGWQASWFSARWCHWSVYQVPWPSRIQHDCQRSFCTADFSPSCCAFYWTT